MRRRSASGTPCGKRRSNVPRGYLWGPLSRFGVVVALIVAAIDQVSKLWLLDEVLTSLDKGAVSLVRSLIENHVAGGGIAIVATHQELELQASRTKRLELTT